MKAPGNTYRAIIPFVMLLSLTGASYVTAQVTNNPPSAPPASKSDLPSGTTPAGKPPTAPPQEGRETPSATMGTAPAVPPTSPGPGISAQGGETPKASLSSSKASRTTHGTIQAKPVTKKIAPSSSLNSKQTLTSSSKKRK
jgi:hypothetical protein